MKKHLLILILISTLTACGGGTIGTGIIPKGPSSMTATEWAGSDGTENQNLENEESAQEDGSDQEQVQPKQNQKKKKTGQSKKKNL